MSSPCFGRVIWVTLPDQRGLASERHPAVIITPTAEITPDGTVWVVGVSTKSHLASPDVQTELQYDPRGNCRSLLRRQCWAVSTWLEEIPVSSIEAYAGTIPGRTMLEIYGKIPNPPV